MITKRLCLVVVAVAALLLPACDEKKPAPARRIDHELKQSKNPDEQVRLLREAQQRFGKEAKAAEAPAVQQPKKDVITLDDPPRFNPTFAPELK